MQNESTKNATNLLSTWSTWSRLRRYLIGFGLLHSWSMEKSLSANALSAVRLWTHPRISPVTIEHQCSPTTPVNHYLWHTNPPKWVSTPWFGSQHAQKTGLSTPEMGPNTHQTGCEHLQNGCQLVSRVNKSTPPPPLLLTTTAVVATWSGAKAPNTTRLKDAQRPPSFRIEKNARLLPSLQVAADSKAHIPDSSPTAITN